MTRDELKSIRDQSPFHPFTLVTTNDQRFRVNHPDFLLLPPIPRPPEARAWPDHLIHYDEHAVPTFITLAHIVSVEFEAELQP